MLWLAYDGSLNADWLSHYAVEFARHLKKPQVVALFVDDGSVPTSDITRRLELMNTECERAGVQLVTEVLVQKGSVAETLLHRVPKGPETFLLCGTRVRQRNLSFLAGTVSEALLMARHCHVLALRVVQPGTLGVVHRLLVPVMGPPRPFAGLPFLRLFRDSLESVRALMVSTGGRRGADLQTRKAYLSALEDQLLSALGPVRVEAMQVSSSDPAGEILLQAKQTKSQLIYIGASERSVLERLVIGTPGERILRHAPCDVAIHGCLP